MAPSLRRGLVASALGLQEDGLKATRRRQCSVFPPGCKGGRALRAVSAVWVVEAEEVGSPPRSWVLVLWLQLQQERRKGVWKTWSGAREKRPRQAVLHGRRRWHRLQRRLEGGGDSVRCSLLHGWEVERCMLSLCGMQRRVFERRGARQAVLRTGRQTETWGGVIAPKQLWDVPTA